MKMTRRDTLKSVGCLAVTLPGVPTDVPRPMPPGAGDRERFNRLCVGCGACAANCPGGCLKPSTGLLSLGRPGMDFRTGYCLLRCTVCGDICPTAALKKVLPEQRAHLHLGQAVWKRDLCLRTTTQEGCVACVRKCPVRAVHLVAGFPVVDAAVCIGCGACEHVCPARPEPAIRVKGFDRQREVVKMDERDLLAEMRSLVRRGKALVVARGGVIVLQLEGRGLKPLVEAYATNAKFFAGALVYDKIVGRAAAAYYVAMSTQTVAADVMSVSARDFLEAHGVSALAENFVPEIINRAATGVCPMEAAVAQLDDPRQMIETIGKAVEK